MKLNKKQRHDCREPPHSNGVSRTRQKGSKCKDNDGVTEENNTLGCTSKVTNMNLKQNMLLLFFIYLCKYILNVCRLFSMF